MPQLRVRMPQLKILQRNAATKAGHSQINKYKSTFKKKKKKSQVSEYRSGRSLLEEETSEPGWSNGKKRVQRPEGDWVWRCRLNSIRVVASGGRKEAHPGPLGWCLRGSGLVLPPERQGSQGGPVSGSDPCLESSPWEQGEELGSRSAETDVKTEGRHRSGESGLRLAREKRQKPPRLQ